MVDRRGLLVLAVGAVTAAPLAAWQDGPAGWIGVRVQQRYECVWEAREEWKTCDLVLNITEMQPRGPAASGGLELGAELIAINGEEVDYRNWGRLLGSIRAGTPLSIDVMRGPDRHFVHVIPQRRPPDAESVRMLRRAPQVVGREHPRSFVFRLTEPRGADRVAVALTVRDTENQDVMIEPSVVREVNGQLRVAALDEDVFVELPELRVELLGDLDRVAESTYENASSALEVFDRVRANLTYREFRERLRSIAETALEETELAMRFSRVFAGAEFEPVSGDAGQSGLLVLTVARGTAASRLGLRTGDLVVRVGDIETRSLDGLVRAVRTQRAPRVYWIRDGREVAELWPRR